MNSITFTNFTALKDADLIRILHYRNRDDIRVNMSNTEIIAESDHLAFCHSLRHNQSARYYLIQVNGEDCAVLTITNIDMQKKSCLLGHYFVDDKYKEHIDIMPSCMRLYKSLGIYYPSAYVKKDNIKALLLNTIKYKAHIQSEDDKYYYLEFPDLSNYLSGTITQYVEPLYQRLNSEYDISIIENSCSQQRNASA